MLRWMDKNGEVAALSANGAEIRACFKVIQWSCATKVTILTNSLLLVKFLRKDITPNVWLSAST